MITVYGQNVDVEQLRKVEVVTPKIVTAGHTSGSKWQGIQHGMLVDLLQKIILNRGWDIQESQFALSKDQADLVGAFQLNLPDLDAPDGQAFSLGLMTSNSMKRALRLYVGTRIALCNNGMATGEIVMQKKHTLRLDLSVEIEQSLDVYFQKATEVKRVVSRMQQYELHQSQEEHILIEAGRQGILPWSRIGKVDAEYNHSSFAEREERTSWNLYNAFTHIVKQQPALTQMDKMNQFRELIPLAA